MPRGIYLDDADRLWKVDGSRLVFFTVGAECGSDLFCLKPESDELVMQLGGAEGYL